MVRLQRGYSSAILGIAMEGRQVVVTGGAGALGRAVVEAFVAAGAVVHVPVRGKPPADGLAGVNYVPGVDLTDEAAVVAFYSGLPEALWASVHVAGGFGMAGITQTTLADLRAQLDVNLVSAFLCCREAVRRFRARPGAGGTPGQCVGARGPAARGRQDRVHRGEDRRGGADARVGGRAR